ncbi:MAG: PKD domain-containing protein [Saprospiraceae bacterium]|nr:PKD domain-containing protein [Saprospiraceae bacterium]
MRTIIAALFCIVQIISTTIAQQNWVFPDTSHSILRKNNGSAIQNSALSGTIQAQHITENWDIRLKKDQSITHASSVNQTILDSIRQLNFKTIPVTNKFTITSDSVMPPFQGRQFRGNSRDNSVPLDNSMAVSRNGFLVSGINTNVVFAGPDGNITFTRGLADFFQLLGLGSRMYDPRVMYDSEQQKFILMCLHGSEPSNTFLCIAFSKTEDPNGEWNYYKIDGNPDGDNNWFDYPNVALSKEDLFISGLMRNTDGNWQYTVLYQIDKMAGFAGNQLSWKYYNEIKDADGQPSFNLVPTPSGWTDLSPASMYFISNEELGGDSYNLHVTTGKLSDNPTLISMQSKGLSTTLAPYGRQNATNAVLNTFDSRIWSALYLNGIIHMGSHVRTANGEVGLFYGRMDVKKGEVTAEILSVPGKDLAYPSFTAFGMSPMEEKILVNYLISGPDQFPSQQQRICQGSGRNFSWSEPNTLQTGSSQVDFLAGNLERWGDYTTACRRFLPKRTESWVTGCFGESRSYGTWLGQFFTQEEAKFQVLPEFIADKTTAPASQAISFTDLTPHQPTKWQWFFENGQPATSEERNPVVKYAENGAYNVTLIVRNERGIDTLTKEDYIHISDPVVKPVADFTFNRDTIYKDESVQFSEKCSENTVTYKWTFQNGSPATSTENNPLIKYTKTGSHLVSLTATNIAGSNTKIRQKAVTVLERSRPDSRFGADKTMVLAGSEVQFADLTSGGPTSWSWQFEGGSPQFSQDQNPSVKYEEAGSFGVTLIASNQVGSDTVFVADYIKVVASSVHDAIQDEFRVSLFPNPCSGEEVHINFTLPEFSSARWEIRDSRGTNIKTLLDEKLKAGTYTLLFNSDMLLPGTYTILLHTNGKTSGAYRLVSIH